MESYADLLTYLQSLTKEQLAQKVQAFLYQNNDRPVKLLPLVSANTVENLCHVDGEVCTETRDVTDFKHHPEQVVLLLDSSPWTDEGDMFLKLNDDGSLTGVQTGLTYPTPF